MIDAVTYGMIPSANSENRESAPAGEEVQQAEDVPPWPLKYSLIVAESTPGAGTHEPRRYSARINAVKRTRCRSSGTRHALASQEST